MYILRHIYIYIYIYKLFKIWKPQSFVIDVESCTRTTQRCEPKQIDIVSLECNVGLQPPIEWYPIKFSKICQAYLKIG